MYATPYPTPSTYHPPPKLTPPADYDSENDASKSAKSQFQNIDECREYLRRELPRAVRATMEQYVNKLFEDIQEKANQKTAEIIHNVETTMLRTFQFQEEASSIAALHHPQTTGNSNREPSSPPLSPESGKAAQQLLDGLRDDPLYNELCSEIQFNVVDQVLSGGLEYSCDNFSMDSAYFTSSSSGGDQSFAIGNFDFVPRLD